VKYVGLHWPLLPYSLPELERGDVGRRQDLDLVAGRLEHRLDQPLVLPGQAAEQDGDLVAFLGREGALDRGRHRNLRGPPPWAVVGQPPLAHAGTIDVDVRRHADELLDRGLRFCIV
jgi:hypothetical protein